MKKITSLLLASTMLFTFAVTPAYASSIENGLLIEENKDIADTTLESAAALEPYLNQNEDGTLFLDDKVDELNLSEDFLKSIQENLEISNSLIKDGYITADDQGSILFTDKILEDTNSSNITIEGNSLITKSFLRAYGGVDRVDFY